MPTSVSNYFCGNVFLLSEGGRHRFSELAHVLSQFGLTQSEKDLADSQPSAFDFVPGRHKFGFSRFHGNSSLQDPFLHRPHFRFHMSGRALFVVHRSIDAVDFVALLLPANGPIGCVSRNAMLARIPASICGA